jgi:hypothetical protein
MNERPIHFLTRRGTNPLRVCACGKVPHRYTIEPEKASCHECARQADDLTPQQRDTIWENANDRTNKNKRSPWADQVASQAKATATP